MRTDDEFDPFGEHACDQRFTGGVDLAHVAKVKVERSCGLAVSVPAPFELSDLLGVEVAVYANGRGRTGIGGFDGRHKDPHVPAESTEIAHQGCDWNALPWVMAVTDNCDCRD